MVLHRRRRIAHPRVHHRRHFRKGVVSRSLLRTRRRGRLPGFRKRVHGRKRHATGLSKSFVSKVWTALSPPKVYTVQDGGSVGVPQIALPPDTVHQGFVCNYYSFIPSLFISHLANIFQRIHEISIVTNDSSGIVGTYPYVRNSAFMQLSFPSMKIQLDNVIHKMSVTNNSNARANVEFYYYRLRKAVPFILGYTNMQQLLLDGFNDNNYAWQIGEADPTEQKWHPATSPLNNIELNPFNSAKFIRYNKIYKVKKFTLHGGQSITFQQKTSKRMIHASDNFTIQGASAFQAPAQWNSINAFPTGGKGIMVKFWGIPAPTAVAATFPPITGQTDVTETAPLLSFWSSYKYTYRHVLPQGGDYYRSDVTGNIVIPAPTGAVVTTEFGQTKGNETN